MSRVGFSHIHLDIYDRILASLPDLPSLRSCILVSKSFYTVYKDHKTFLLREVLNNEIGAALPFATTFIRAKDALRNTEYSTQTILKNLIDNQSVFWKTEYTMTEAHILSYLASTTKRLESHFSNLYKCRCAPYNKMLEMEQFRFYRALYRILLMVAINHEANRRPDLDISFISSLSDDELYQITEVYKFLDKLAQVTVLHPRVAWLWLANLDLDRTLELFATFPANAYKEIPLDSSPAALPNTRIEVEYTNLINTRDIRRLDSEVSYAAILIDSLCSETCSECGESSQYLYNESNLHWLSNLFGAFPLSELLPGHLFRNGILVAEIQERIFSPSFDISRMYIEMLEGGNDTRRNQMDDSWICERCVKRFIGEHFLSWFTRDLIKNGHVFQKNCWYGYNCRTQVHRFEHAHNLNHLCDPLPSRDDYTKSGSKVIPGVIQSINDEEGEEGGENSEDGEEEESSEEDDD